MSAVPNTGRYVALITMGLVGLGIVMIYSSSSVLANTKFSDSSFFLVRQIVRALVGMVLMIILARVPLGFWARTARFWLLLGLGLLVLVLMIGKGLTQRWLPLPFVTLQPSEYIKLAIVLYLADVLVRQREKMQSFGSGLLPRLVLVGLVLGLIVLQPDLGTALTIGFIALVMLWVGGARIWHLIGTGLAGLPVIGLSLYFSPYQLQRIKTFLGLEGADEQGAGYQIGQALLALGSGGLGGVGLGNSMQKYHHLPEPHTDFVFAFIGEELGLLGTLGVIGLFVSFAFLGLKIARQASTYYGFLVATGITAMVTIYALLNVGVATGVLPTTGLPLPFISYGGSSLIFNMGGVGILIAVERQGAVVKHKWADAVVKRKLVRQGQWTS